MPTNTKTFSKLDLSMAREHSLLRRFHDKLLADYTVPDECEAFGTHLHFGGCAILYVRPDGSGYGYVCDRPSDWLKGDQWSSPEDAEFGPGTYDPRADWLDVSLVQVL